MTNNSSRQTKETLVKRIEKQTITMEAHLLTVSEALMDIADRGRGHQLEDCGRCSRLDHLDVVASLETAMSASAIREELQDYLHVDHICSAGLEKIFYIWHLPEDEGGAIAEEEFFIAGRIEVLTTIMSNHVNSVDIQTNGCKLIHKLMQWTFCDHVRPSWSLLSTPLSNAIRNDQDHVAVLEAAYASFPFMQLRF
jgi:hypothetical protein